MFSSATQPASGMLFSFASFELGCFTLLVWRSAFYSDFSRVSSFICLGVVVLPFLISFCVFVVVGLLLLSSF